MIQNKIKYLYKFSLFLILFLKLNTLFGQYIYQGNFEGKNNTEVYIKVELIKLNAWNCQNDGFNYTIDYNWEVSVYKDGEKLENYKFYNVQFYFQIPLGNSNNVYGNISITNPGKGSAKTSTDWYNTRLHNCDAISLENIEFENLKIIINSEDFASEDFYVEINNEPLPIELIDFTVKNTEYGNELFWSTASEINNEYFILEISDDAINFFEIAKLEGAGNSSQTLNYSYLDNSFTTEISYYRLKQVDFDKKFTYSKIISVANTLTAEFSIYPNPVVENINIEFLSQVENEYIVDIFNQNSQKVYSEKLNISKGFNNFTFNIFNNLESGVYFFVIKDSKGNIIIKEKIINQSRL